MVKVEAAVLTFENVESQRQAGRPHLWHTNTSSKYSEQLSNAFPRTSTRSVKSLTGYATLAGGLLMHTNNLTFLHFNRLSFLALFDYCVRNTCKETETDEAVLL